MYRIPIRPPLKNQHLRTRLWSSDRPRTSTVAARSSFGMGTSKSPASAPSARRSRHHRGALAQQGWLAIDVPPVHTVHLINHSAENIDQSPSSGRSGGLYPHWLALVIASIPSLIFRKGVVLTSLQAPPAAIAIAKAAAQRLSGMDANPIRSNSPSEIHIDPTLPPNACTASRTAAARSSGCLIIAAHASEV